MGGIMDDSERNIEPHATDCAASCVVDRRDSDADLGVPRDGLCTSTSRVVGMTVTGRPVSSMPLANGL